ncbi:hypothetical protein QTP88_015074 [Uroleucon formosanum]
MLTHDDSNIMTTVSNEKLITPTTKEPLVSEVFKMSNDLGNFINKKLNDTYKRLIFDMGPLKPPGPFPKDPHQGNMSFSESYIFQTKYGPVNRFWLCYYPLLDATYCQPCWLFSLQRSTWCTGLRDWKHLSERIKEHGFSKNHIEACAVYEMWQKNINIDKDLENQIRKEASFWRMVLQRLFDIIITLATNSLALKGHWEDLSLEGYHGNFLSVVQLVSRYDQVLNQVLEMPKGSTRYLSPTVQNEMIECIVDIDLDQASNVLEETKDKLKMYRNDFESFYNKATKTARKYDIDLHFQVKRRRKIKKH